MLLLLSCKLKISFPVTTDLRHWLAIDCMGQFWELACFSQKKPTKKPPKNNWPVAQSLFCTSLQHPVDIFISFQVVAHSFLSFSFPLSSQVHIVAVESLATSHWKANLFVCLCQVIWFTVPASIASSQDCLLWAAGAQMDQALITHSFILLTDGQRTDIWLQWVSMGWTA